MPAPWIPVQFGRILHKTCTNRIQVNVPNQFLEISIFLANDGLIAILEQMPVSGMPQIVRNRIPREKASHKSRQTDLRAAHKNVGVIRQQSPCKNPGLGFSCRIAHAGYKVFSILVVSDDFTRLYAPDNNMVQCPRGIQSCLSRHRLPVPPSNLVL